MFVGPLVADVDVAGVTDHGGVPGLLQRLHQARRSVALRHRLILLVLGDLLDDRADLLVHGDDHDEGRGSEGPAPADRGPDVEACEVEDVDGEHGPRPQADEEKGEKDGGGVGSNLGCAEFADDDF